MRKFPVTEEVTTMNRIIFLRLESLILKESKMTSLRSRAIKISLCFTSSKAVLFNCCFCQFIFVSISYFFLRRNLVSCFALFFFKGTLYITGFGDM